MLLRGRGRRPVRTGMMLCQFDGCEAEFETWTYRRRVGTRRLFRYHCVRSMGSFLVPAVFRFFEIGLWARRNLHGMRIYLPCRLKNTRAACSQTSSTHASCIIAKTTNKITRKYHAKGSQAHVLTKLPAPHRARADIPHFPTLYRIMQRFHRLLDRHTAIEPMDLQ